METITLKFKASGQKLSADSCPQKYASNTVNYIQAEFDLDANWKSFDSVRAVWHNDFACISTVLDGSGRCTVPHEVLENLDEVHVNLVGSIVDGTELTDRLTTYPLRVAIINAEALICGTETAEVTPSQFEQYIAIVEDLVHSVKDITSCVLNADYTLTINYSDGTSDTVGPIRGAQGPQGVPGQTGNGIQSITKTGTAGLVDTYRITYTNGAHYDYTVTNGAKGETGNGIESIYLTGTSGAVKTYTILFTNGDTFEYQVTDGEVTFAALDTMLEPLLIKDTASGDIASFPDGQNVYPLRKCEVDITPVQDLNGYDAPWVGGGGVNKFDASTIVQGDFDSSLPTHNCKTDYIPISANQTYTLSQTSSTNGRYVRFYNSSKTEEDTSTRVTAYNQTVSTFTTPNWAVYCRIMWYVTDNEIVPSDIVALKPQLELGSSATTWTPYSNICPISGRSSVGVTGCGKNLLGGTRGEYLPLFIPSGTVVTASYLPNNGSGRIYYYDKDKNYIDYWAMTTAGSGGRYYRTFTLIADAYYFQWTNDDGSNYQLEFGASAASYEAYNPTTHTIPLGQTVYGGVVDCVSGVMTVNYYIFTLDGTENAYGVGTSGGVRYFTWNVLPHTSKNTNATDTLLYSNMFESKTGVVVGHSYIIGNGTILVFVLPQDVTTSEEAHALFQNTNAQFALPLATPITIQLTPTEISTLQGNNNVWSDAGEVEVLYVADTGLYIDKKTS